MVQKWVIHIQINHADTLPFADTSPFCNIEHNAMHHNYKMQLQRVTFTHLMS